MEGKEKMTQIFEDMADMTIEIISREKGSALYLTGSELEMVRATESLYETLNCTNQTVVAAAYENSIPESGKKGQYGCNYTDNQERR